ncbi:dNA repair protein RecO [Firmicutes bacterium CAG:582]|nr:dNA repair protein RecO [Firmicutes bacterium CAG:582]
MLKKIRGIVVSEVPYKDSSKVLNILCEEGVIGVISKGCKRINSPLRVISNKLTLGEYVIYYNESKLSTLKEGSILDNFNNIKNDLNKISHATYITDLVNQVMKQNADPTVFSLYLSALKKIDEGINETVVMNILEIKLLDYLGVGINLNGCAKCGSTREIVTIDPDVGGYICKNCYTNEIIYDERVRKMLRMYYLVEIDSIKELKIKDYVIDSINKFLSVYYDRYTGLYIRSKEFLDRNIKI